MFGTEYALVSMWSARLRMTMPRDVYAPLSTVMSIASAVSLPSGVGAELDGHVERVALGRDEHRFREARHVPDGPSEVEGGRRRDPLGDDLHLDPELAARERLLVADRLPAQGGLERAHREVDVDAPPDDDELGVLALAVHVREAHLGLHRAPGG